MTQTELGRAALLVDLENLFLAMRDCYPEPSNLTVAVLQALREHMEAQLGITPIVGRAYAPFDYSGSRTMINDLSLMGITPFHVLSHVNKNSADLMLAIDCMELLFRREDIQTFVIVGGDRDYIPVVERVGQNARKILVVCPRHAMSGDLLTVIGESNYLDPMSLVHAAKRSREGELEKVKAPLPFVPKSRKVLRPSTMDDVSKLVASDETLDDLKKLTKIILDFRRSKKVNEVWLGPFLHVLNSEFPLRNNVERKDLLSQLVSLGAISITERSRGKNEGTYAVLLVNWKHPLIVEMNLE